MSAEVEKKEEEEEQPEPKRPLRKRVLDHWQLGFKLLELVLAAVCVGFAYEPIETTGLGKTYLHHVILMITAYTGSMVINIGLIVGRVLGDKLGYKTSFVFSVANAALFVASGILLASNKSDLTKNQIYHPRLYLINMMIIVIIVSFINALVFVADAVLTFKRQQDF